MFLYLSAGTLAFYRCAFDLDGWPLFRRIHAIPGVCFVRYRPASKERLLYTRRKPYCDASLY